MGVTQRVAPQAGLVTAPPVEIDGEAQELAVAQIDSAFYDGLTLNLAFSIAQGAHYEPYVPDASELAAMEETVAMPVAIEHPQAPGAEVLSAYNQALQSQTPYGYRAQVIYASDHTSRMTASTCRPMLLTVPIPRMGPVTKCANLNRRFPMDLVKGTGWSFASRSINPCRRST